MENNESDLTEVMEKDGEVELETPEDNSEEVSDETDWKSEALKYKAIAERAAKKAHKPQPATNVEVSAPKSNDISTMDAIALVRSGVTLKEDIDQVKEYAQLKGVSIEEALSSKMIKTILQENAEVRKTAQATNISTSRRSNTPVSEDDLLKKFRQTGEVPESQDDLERMIEARLMNKK